MANSKVKEGEYCVRCDTVWAPPGNCRCFKSKETKEMKQHSQEEIEKYVSHSISELDKQIWNAAIEKAAQWLQFADRNDTDDANEVRKLKK